MLRGTPDHPKFVALAATLRLPKPHVVGLLELLWHFTSRYAPQGDVGRWPDAAIEGACSWDGKAGALVAAFVSCRWIDESKDHRLVVHDWHEHADRYVKRRLANQGRVPVGRPKGACRAPKGRPKGDQVGAPPVAVPVPVPEPEPEPEKRIAAPAALAVVETLSWSKQACDDWIDRYGGTAPGGQIGKALKPLVVKHGWSAVRQAWRSYLEQAEADYASASRFASTYGRWSGASPDAVKVTVADKTRANLQAWVAGKEGA